MLEDTLQRAAILVAVDRERSRVQLETERKEKSSRGVPRDAAAAATGSALLAQRR